MWGRGGGGFMFIENKMHKFESKLWVIHQKLWYITHICVLFRVRIHQVLTFTFLNSSKVSNVNFQSNIKKARSHCVLKMKFDFFQEDQNEKMEVERIREQLMLDLKTILQCSQCCQIEQNLEICLESGLKENAERKMYSCSQEHLVWN